MFRLRAGKSEWTAHSQFCRGDEVVADWQPSKQYEALKECSMEELLVHSGLSLQLGRDLAPYEEDRR
jgi:hypothetical protein